MTVLDRWLLRWSRNYRLLHHAVQTVGRDLARRDYEAFLQPNEEFAFTQFFDGVQMDFEVEVFRIDPGDRSMWVRVIPRASLRTPLDLKPSLTHEFPADEFGDGFDNDGDVLTTSQLSAEKYLEAAQDVIETAMADPTARAKIMPCEPSGATEAACISSTVSEFARRAFRRPVAADELAPFLTLVDVAKGKGDTAEVGLKLVLEALLLAPDFLFMAEPDPTPSVVRACAGGASLRAARRAKRAASPRDRRRRRRPLR